MIRHAERVFGLWDGKFIAKSGRASEVAIRKAEMALECSDWRLLAWYFCKPSRLVHLVPLKPETVGCISQRNEKILA
jgi:hypothetical protein